MLYVSDVFQKARLLGGCRCLFLPPACSALVWCPLECVFLFCWSYRHYRLVAMFIWVRSCALRVPSAGWLYLPCRVLIRTTAHCLEECRWGVRCQRWSMLCSEAAKIGRTRQYLICSRPIVGIDWALSSVLVFNTDDTERINGVAELLYRRSAILACLRADRKRVLHLSITHWCDDVL